MSTIEFLLIFFGSVFHLAWNILAKEAKDKFHFLFAATFICGTLGTLFYFFSGELVAVSKTALFYLLLSGLIHGVYFYSLAKSLQSTDLSVVYPYARGIGSLLATLGGLWWLGESPNTQGQWGIFLTVLATFLEPLSKIRGKRQLGRSEIFTTFLTGLSIAAYFLVDKKGVVHLRSGPYLSLLLLLSSLIFLAFNFTRKKVQLPTLFTWGSRHLLASFFMFASYGLILKAMESAPLTYVVATRAVGVVLSGIAGLFLFKEKVGAIRWVSIVLISIGIYLVGTA